MFEYFWRHNICGNCRKARKCKKIVTKRDAVNEWVYNEYSLYLCKQCLKEEKQ